MLLRCERQSTLLLSLWLFRKDLERRVWGVHTDTGVTRSRRIKRCGLTFA